jgi:hypothetical protein
MIVFALERRYFERYPFRLVIPAKAGIALWARKERLTS